MPLGRYQLLAGAFLALVAALTLYNGPTVIGAPTDVFILLNGGWRIFLGQVPHVDFSNPIGVFTYALVAAGMAISGTGAGSIVWACVLFGVPISLLAAAVAYSRFEHWLAFCVVILLTLVSFATRPLGYDPANHSYAMLYDRFGYVLLFILLLTAFVVPRQPEGGRRQWEPVAIGAVLALLFYTKITFALIGLFGLSYGLFVRPDLRTRGAMIAGLVGFTAVVAVIWLTVGVTPAAYVSDLTTAAVSQSLAARLEQIKAVMKACFLTLLALSVGWSLIVGRRILADRSLSAKTLDVTLQFAFLCGAALALSGTDATEQGQVPLLVLAGVILIHNRSLAPADALRPVVLAVSLAATLLPAAWIAVPDVASIADTTAFRSYRLTTAPPEQRIRSARLADFVVSQYSTHNTQFWPASVFPSRINEGLVLLRPHVRSSTRIFEFALTDTFSIALGLPPPRGGLLWWDRNFSYSLSEHPEPQGVFSEVTMIVVPIVDTSSDGCCFETAIDLPQIYHDYVAANFVEVDRSPHWILLERRELRRPTPPRHDS